MRRHAEGRYAERPEYVQAARSEIERHQSPYYNCSTNNPGLLMAERARKRGKGSMECINRGIGNRNFTNAFLTCRMYVKYIACKICLSRISRTRWILDVFEGGETPYYKCSANKGGGLILA